MEVTLRGRNPSNFVDGLRMDPTTNPYAPGAGTRPPELAGRDQVLEDARVALARVKAGRAAKSQMLLGLRGVGKTVLLKSKSSPRNRLIRRF
jgi:Cdc6-like AAA superfamily ATPase